MSYGFNTIVSKTSGGSTKSPSSKQRTIALIDMDSFFASCEEVCDPKLKKKPVIICGRFKRGVVTTANQLAKEKYDIHVGMSGNQAKFLCPQGVFLVGDLDKYIYFSRQINHIVSQFSPHVEPYSIDEFFLDLTNCPGEENLKDLGTTIKETIRSKLGLSSTIGFGPNRFLAKMACCLGKPDGLHRLDYQSYQKHYWSHPLTSLWGIGSRGAKQLNKLGITTVSQLAHYPRKVLKSIFGLRGDWYHDMAWGRDASLVGKYNSRPNRSYGHSYTLKKDSRQKDIVLAILFRLCDKCTFRMRQDGFWGRTIHLAFETEYGLWQGHQITLSSPTQTDIKVFKTCCQILFSYPLNDPLRRLSMRVSNLVSSKTRQPDSLFEISQEGADRKVLEILDKIRYRFGDRSLMRGRNLIDFQSLKAIHFQTARRFQSKITPL